MRIVLKALIRNVKRDLQRRRNRKKQLHIVEIAKKRRKAKAKKDKNVRKKFNKSFKELLEEATSNITTSVKSLKIWKNKKVFQKNK